MKTNYQNLTMFESLAVVVAAAGVVLISAMVVASLDANVQKSLSRAVQVLDMHETAVRDFGALKNYYVYYDDFFQKTYIAASELLAVPERDVAMARQAISSSRQSYEKMLAWHPPERGRVLGASIEVKPPEREPLVLEIKFEQINFNKILIR